MKSLILFSILLSTLSSVHAYYFMGSLTNVLPFKSMMASAQFNNSLYLFGGENATSHYSNDLYKLTQTSDGYSWLTVPQKNPINGTAGSQAFVTSDQQNLVLLGGDSFTEANASNFLPLQIYTYNFASQTWTSKTPTNFTLDNTACVNRQAFSATYDSKNKVSYIYGGFARQSVLDTLHKMDENYQTTSLGRSPEARYGHTTSILR